MKQLIPLIYLILILFLTVGCDRKNISDHLKDDAQFPKASSSSIDLSFISTDSIDFSVYPQMIELQAWIADTITESGWSIEYLVRPDSTLLNDLYIRVRKDNFENIYEGKELLKYRRYFIPSFVCETKNEIVMKHGCATDCSAITLISKKISNTTEEFTHVIDFSKEKNILIHVTDSSYSNEGEMFQIELLDLNSKKRSKLTLSGICTTVFKPSCIDTIIYSPEGVEVFTNLRESMEALEYAKQRHLIKL